MNAGKKRTRSKIVTEALRKHYGLSIGEFAEKLGVGASTVSSWSARDSLDEDLVFRKCEGVSFEFLTTGEGPMFVSDTDSYRIQIGKGMDLEHDLILAAILKKVSGLSDAEKGEAYTLLSKRFNDEQKLTGS